MEDNRSKIKFRLILPDGNKIEIFDTSKESLKFLKDLGLNLPSQLISKYNPLILNKAIRLKQDFTPEVVTLQEITLMSKIDQIKILIRSYYPNNESQNRFTSKDIFSDFTKYLSSINTSISQSTVSTYLHRLYKDFKIIHRIGTKKNYEYTLKREEMDKIPYFDRLNVVQSQSTRTKP